MQKIIPQDSFDYPEAEHLVQIVDDPSMMKRKVAGVIRDTWGDIRPQKGKTLVHLLALSTFEKVGCNQNADAFEEYICAKQHSDFKKTARLYRHHKKTEEDKKDGDVIKTAFNKKMGRVELLISAIDEKCADWLGEVDKGGKVNFSMGWKCTNGDICSLCSNRARKRDEYCEHLNKTASAPYGLGKILPDGRKCFTFNRDGFWNDISYVGKGADMTAMDFAKIASAHSFNDVVIGGAELAEKLFPVQTVLEKKGELLAYFSDVIFPRFVKADISMATTPSSISKKTAQEIAHVGFDATRAAYRLNNSIMPFDVFLYSLDELTKTAGVLDAMSGAYHNFDKLAKNILSSKDSMSGLAKSESFCSIGSNSDNVLSDEARTELSSQTNTVDGSYFIPDKVASEKVQPNDVSSFLVGAYLDYKATEAAMYNKSNEELFDTFLLN